MSALLDALHQPHTQLLLRLVLGGLLLLAGVTKLAGRRAFYEAVADYDVLPGLLQRPFAALVPLVEVTLGALLLLGLGTRAAAALATPLFLSFGIAIGINMLRGRNFDCHCFGAAQRERIGWPALIRSAALVLAALVVAIGASRFGSLELALFGSNGDLPSEGEAIPMIFLAAVVFDVLFLLPETLAFREIFRRAQAERMRHALTHRHEEASTSA
jgi:uncharacterized membrane protein YphA (DoxX/SURF4 family)